MVRGLQVEHQHSPGYVRFQVLVMQAGTTLAEFEGRYEIRLAGVLDGKPRTSAAPAGPQLF